MDEDQKLDCATKRILKYIAGIIAAVIVAFFTIQYQMVADRTKAVDQQLSNHEARLTKTETCLQYISSDISEIKALTQEIRKDQVRRERRDSR